MSFTNIVDEGKSVIVQGVNGIRFVRETWMADRKKVGEKTRYSQPKKESIKNTTGMK